MASDVLEAPAPQVAGGWTPKEEPRLAAEQLDRWRGVVRRLAMYADRLRLSRTAVSSRSGVPMGTLSPWLDGKYTGNYEAVADRLVRWLDAEDERSERVVDTLDEPEFVMTPTAREVYDTLMWAQTRPGMVVIALGSGMGKTTTAEYYRSMVPSTYMVTMRPRTRTVTAMLAEVAREIGVAETKTALIDSAIGEKLRRNGRKTLLIIDEAQNLDEEAVNQIRWWLDRYRCGIALMGNMDVQTKYGGTTPKVGFGQIHSRVSKRLFRLEPKPQDIAMVIESWGITDPRARQLLAAIGRKAGALRQIVETLQLARVLAHGEGVAVTDSHVRMAWQNRGNEDMR
jgi:DNA transposition AAA+ family ATPase